MTWLPNKTRNAKKKGGGGFPIIATARHRWYGGDISTMWEDSDRTTPATPEGAVGSWLDTISGAYSYNPTEAQRPVINEAGDGLIFDGSDSWLGVPKADLSWLNGTSANVRIFAIVDPTVLASTKIIFGSAWFRADFQLKFAALKLEFKLRGMTPSIVPSTEDMTTTLQLIEGEFDNDDNKVYVVSNNGARTDYAAKTTNIDISASSILFSLGANAGAFGGSSLSNFQGDIKELVMTEEMTEEEHTNLMAYFASEYGLSL